MGNILKFLGFCSLCIWAQQVFAQTSPRDVLLSNGECALHYLTHRDTTGWKLANIEGGCVNGFLDGTASARILNAFDKTAAFLQGQFNQGYYVEKTEIPLSLSTLYSDKKTQIFSYSLPPDDGLSLSYNGYLISEELSDGDYGPFLACRPVRLMAITPNIELFEDEIFQQALINSAFNRAKMVCPTETHIYLYGSDQDKPDNQLISFFADIDLETRQIKVKRLPPSSRMRDIWNSPDEALPIPKKIRHETGVKVVQITPLLTEVPKQTDPQSAPSSTQDEAVLTVMPPADMTLDAIPHLLTAARLLKQPVSGKALIHIGSFDEEGIAHIDQPLFLKAKGMGLSIGWGIAEGEFNYTTGSKNSPKGFIHIKTFTPYSGVQP